MITVDLGEASEAIIFPSLRVYDHAKVGLVSAFLKAIVLKGQASQLHEADSASLTPDIFVFNQQSTEVEGLSCVMDSLEANQEIEFVKGAACLS